MSDDRLRDLERRAKLGEDVREKLRAEQVRLGLRKAFPPRKKVPQRERAGFAFPAWCPACGNWSLRKLPQKYSAFRGRADAPLGHDGTRVRPSQFDDARFFPNGKPDVYYRIPRRMVPLQGRKRSRRSWCSYIFHGTGPPNPDPPSRCPGPAPGQDCRAPLRVLYERFNLLQEEWEEIESRGGGQFIAREDRLELEWLLRRVDRERARLERLAAWGSSPDRCYMACPHGDRCVLPYDHADGCSHRGCDCNEPNAPRPRDPVEQIREIVNVAQMIQNEMCVDCGAEVIGHHACLGRPGDSEGDEA